MAVISMSGQEFLALFASVSWHCFPLFWLISPPPVLRQREFWHGMSAFPVYRLNTISCHVFAIFAWFSGCIKLHLQCNGSQICPAKLISWIRRSEILAHQGSAADLELLHVTLKLRVHILSAGDCHTAASRPAAASEMCSCAWECASYVSRSVSCLYFEGGCIFTLILDVSGCVRDGLTPRAVLGFHDDWSHYDNRIAAIAVKTSASLRKLEQKMAPRGPGVRDHERDRRREGQLGEIRYVPEMNPLITAMMMMVLTFLEWTFIVIWLMLSFFLCKFRCFHMVKILHKSKQGINSSKRLVIDLHELWSKTAVSRWSITAVSNVAAVLMLLFYILVYISFT